MKWEEQQMRLYLIACNVFLREVCLTVAESPNVVDIKFVESSLHERPQYLRQILQQEIDAVDEKNYEAIVLAYGLCGKAVEGLKARSIPLIIPIAHDCITLFLGSRRRYDEFFAQHPGTYYYTPSAVERGGLAGSESPESKEARFAEYVEKYGEENARYLMEVEESWTKHYTRAAYIDIPPLRFLGHAERTRAIAQDKNLEYVEVAGDLSLLRRLVNGPWDESEFLRVPPGKRVLATMDNGKIMQVAG